MTPASTLPTVNETSMAANELESDWIDAMQVHCMKTELIQDEMAAQESKKPVANVERLLN